MIRSKMGVQQLGDLAAKAQNRVEQKGLGVIPEQVPNDEVVEPKVARLFGNMPVRLLTNDLQFREDVESIENFDLLSGPTVVVRIHPGKRRDTKPQQRTSEGLNDV